MKRLLLLTLALLAGLGFGSSTTIQDYGSLRAEAERQDAEHSFSLAHRTYDRARALKLTDEERRWVEFRLGDTRWRAAAASSNPDHSELDAARRELEKLAETPTRVEERGDTWAEIHESIGDWYWMRRNSRNWSGWNHYEKALGYWASSTELDVARDRYLGIVFKLAEPPQSDPHRRRNQIDRLPDDTLRGAVQVATESGDVARVNYYLAMKGRRHGADATWHQRTGEAFRRSIEQGPENEAYDDALYDYGVWLEERGELHVDAERGTWTEPDNLAALVIYRRLLEEYERGETQYHDQTRERVKALVSDAVSVSVGQTFLPGSKLQFDVRWRNVKRIDFALYPVELFRAVELRERGDSQNAWLDTIDLSRHEASARWDFETLDDGRHRWGNRTLPIDRELAGGAYVLTARGGEASSRNLVLISDAALVVKTHGPELLAWFADVGTGEPIGEADIRLWHRMRHQDVWQSESASTDENGVALFDLETETGRRRSYFLAASDGIRQAFSLAWEPWRPGATEGWKFYAFTDRATYRPGQEVSWKLQVRHETDGRYETPAGETFFWEITGPTGDVQAKGNLRLNDFGTAWGKAEPQDSWPLGPYMIRFYLGDGEQKRSNHCLGVAQLFRLEEYKLPEFLVGVELPTDEGGSPRRFHLGDPVEATIQADYYFGGGVGEATVEVLVYQRTFWHRWQKEREFPWFHDGGHGQNYRWGGPGNIVHQETLKTDAAGSAVVRFDTPAGSGSDLEYTIEARVTDSSRREVSGSGRVRVTRQGWFAYLEIGHNLYRPGSHATAQLHVFDANDRPLVVEGEAALLRRTWREVWLDPQGREVYGEALEQQRRLYPSFPPPVRVGGTAWRIHSRSYHDETISTTTLKTDEAGEASWRVPLSREGYYLVRFASRDERGMPIQAEIPLWCASEGTQQLGYHSDGIALVLDDDTFREGRPGGVMIASPTSGRWVLFTVETDTLIEYRVVHLTGTVKLLSLDVDDRWVPNVFLEAVGFVGNRLSRDHREVIVPPRQHFLDVKVAMDPTESLPGGKGVMTVEVKDHQGEPVAAEVALSLVDASVSAIQEDYAIDPRRFFYGSKRSHHVQTRSSTDERIYARLIEREDGTLVDERYAWFDESEEAAGPRGALTWDRAGGRGLDADESNRLRALGYSAGEAGRAGPRDSVAKNVSSRESSDDFFLGNDKKRRQPVSGGKPSGGEAVVVEVRKDFRETALWKPDVVTDRSGKGRVEFTYPDSLTTWKATARALGHGADFGIARGESATRLPLLVRLQAPRFFVVGDEVIISLNLDNRTDEPIVAAAELDIEGLELLGFLDEGQLRRRPPETITIPAQAGVRVDGLVRVTESGTARFVAQVTGGEHGDALEKELPIYPHGIEALLVKAGRFDGEGVDLVLELPAARSGGTTDFSVQVTPSLAVTMLDALPYLVRYPYGCTEQTLSRFVPAVCVKRTLEQYGLPSEEGFARVFGGIEPEFIEKTQGKPRASLDELDAVVERGLERLYDLQHDDGSWSWWKHGEGDPFMTAYVVWGLALAEEAGVKVDREKHGAGGRWLGEALVEAEKRYDLQAWMLHAHARWLRGRDASKQSTFAARAFQNLMGNRQHLNAYGRALLALAAVDLGRGKEAETLARNLIDGAIVDREPDSSIIPVGGIRGGTQSPRAHWGEDGIGYRWSDGGVEATAFALRALLAIDPEHELLEPAADWLVANRRGAQWSNTKSTAICVLALDDYLRGTGQLARSVGYTVSVNGEEIARAELEGTELIAGPARFNVPSSLIRDGENTVAIRRISGTGPLFFSANASFFSEEEPIPPRGNELFVRRQYFRLAAKPTLLNGFVYERELLEDGDTLKSGERVEVVLTVEAKNHLEYLLFEDLKPAGLEAVEVKSGTPVHARELRADETAYRLGSGEGARSGRGRRPTAERFDVGYTGRTRRVHQELRDRKVAIFLDQCPQGVWEMRYDLRAEVPGHFHALPLLGEAMYVPEIRANGAEIRLEVEDREER